ncbi:MAG: bifunctional 4-hydroxy-2-oxoglutarate aldolase/2-dehydro-3-deoxy-phosphogluconate aldolase [Legionella sp.]|nr:bifunctional 4-hydroxy-2-oxoglutarate aldolase/2-dehydro-3-deoxy-phosphogluconate aldolase [Legionella sp.]
MSLGKVLGNQSLIVSLDVNDFLFDRLEEIIKAGLNLVEINSSDQELLSKLMTQFPALKIGAFGIIDAQQLENCYQANVHFVSSPGFLPAIAQTATIYSMNFMPGVATVSEAMAAMSLGYSHVRPYPAELAFCKTLNKCLPNLKLYPCDVSWDESEDFLSVSTVSAVSVLNPGIKQLNALVSDITV